MRAKMMRRLKRVGHCRVQGHGQGCVLTHEIRDCVTGRAQEKREWMHFLSVDDVARAFAEANVELSQDRQE